MSSEGESRLLASERLRGAENYHSWKSRVYNILEGKGLEEFIEKTCIKPESISPTPSTTTSTASTPSAPTDPAIAATRLQEIKAWKINNGRAKTTI